MWWGGVTPPTPSFEGVIYRDGTFADGQGISNYTTTFISGQTTNKGIATNTNGKIVFKTLNSDNSESSCVLQQSVDLTNYNRLVIAYNDGADKTLTYDISSINGNKYIYLVATRYDGWTSGKTQIACMLRDTLGNWSNWLNADRVNVNSSSTDITISNIYLE